ncbi:MAG: T9SS type A sorting domain-containing protein, partial [Chitinophagales bacterium]
NNPFTDYIVINNLTGDEYFNLINISGQLVFDGYFIQQTDLSFLHNGIYFLKAENKSGIKFAKLLKQ